MISLGIFSADAELVVPANVDGLRKDFDVREFGNGQGCDEATLLVNLRSVEVAVRSLTTPLDLPSFNSAD